MTRPSRREVLADDLRRLAGLAEAAIGEASLLGVEIPDDVLPCVARWRHWSWQLRDQEQEPE